MPVRPVLAWPDARLSRPSADVTEEEFGTEELFSLAQDLVDTMKVHEAAGLAAVQIGVHKRVFAIAHLGEALKDGTKRGVSVVVCNPVVEQAAGSVHRFDEQQASQIARGERGKRLDPRLLVEGCLSFPGVTERLDAPMLVVGRGLSLEGHELTMTAKGIEARAWVHETAHTRGETMLDSMSAARRKAFLKRYMQAKAFRKAS